jgi:Fe-S oxidoreductase
MKDYDKCCGLNGLSNFKEYKIMSKIFMAKKGNIKDTKTQNVLTSCLGCETALKTYALGEYNVYDLIEFIANYL